MAEAFGTVAAAMQLAATVKDIWEFYRDIKDAPKEIIGLRKSLKDLECLLASVETTFQTSSATNNQLDETIHIIRINIQEISAKIPLNDKSKSLKERIKWVLSNKATTKDITTQVESAKLSLAIVLQNITQQANASILDLFISQMNSQSLMLSALCGDFRNFVTASQLSDPATTNISDSSISGIRHHYMGYKHVGNDRFSIMHPVGVLQVTISRYQAENQSGGRLATNTTIRLIPQNQFLGVRKLLQLQYLEVQHRYMLPDPRPKLKVLSIRPKDSPIFYSIKRNDLPMMRYLLASGQASIHDQDENGYNLLQCAIFSDNFDLVETLLQEGVDPNVQDFGSNTAIRILNQIVLEAIYDGVTMESLMGCFRALERHDSGLLEHIDNFDYLVSMHVLILFLQARNKTWAEAERNTVFWNQVSTWTQFLSEIGVDIRKMDIWLLDAASNPNSLVQDFNAVHGLIIFLNMGASITAKDSEGMQALHKVFNPWYRSPIKAYNDSELNMIIEKGIRIVKHAMERDIDIISSTDNDGWTPWDHAVANGYVREYRSVIRACKVNSSILEAEHSCNEWHSWFVDDTDSNHDYAVYQAQVVDIQEDLEQLSATTKSLSPGLSQIWYHREVDFMGEKIEMMGELPEDIWLIISSVAWKATIEPIISRAEAMAFMISFALLSIGAYMNHGLIVLLALLSRWYIQLLQALRL